MKLDYIKTIARNDLRTFFKNRVKNAFEPESLPPKASPKMPVPPKTPATKTKKTEEKPVFRTVNPEYAERLTAMARALKEYLRDNSLRRPFLYLILGPPGAGKSFLIESLINYLGAGEKERQGPIIFQQANLSEFTDPRELHQLYINIKNNTANKLSIITLLDEFDIKWSGGSAIKYLINPIYDGKFWNGNEFQELGKCAFFFAGSYLQDRETLLKTQKLLAGVNLSEFLFDLYFELRKKNDLRGLKEIREIQDLCFMHHKWRAEVDPQTDTIFYLSNLEKIKDFLSRVAGNIFEIVDVSWPLHLTVNEFVIESGLPAEPSAMVKLNEVMRYVLHRIEAEEGKKRMIVYNPNNSPLLEYKNMILCERLLRVSDFLKKRFGKEYKRGVVMDRILLNFLTVAPLINGMRSLEQLVNKLKPDEGGKVKSRPFDFDDISMIVYEAEKFRDPAEVWAQLCRCNLTLEKTVQRKKGEVFIPFKV
jgi:GTPase SAR1 family protein